MVSALLPEKYAGDESGPSTGPVADPRIVVPSKPTLAEEGTGRWSRASLLAAGHGTWPARGPAEITASVLITHGRSACASRRPAGLPPAAGPCARVGRRARGVGDRSQMVDGRRTFFFFLRSFHTCHRVMTYLMPSYPERDATPRCRGFGLTKKCRPKVSGSRPAVSSRDERATRTEGRRGRY